MSSSKKNTRNLVHEKFLKACKSGKLYEVERLYVSHKIDANVLGRDLKTPLFHAITSQSLPIVKFLICHEASLSKKSFVSFRKDCSTLNFESCDEPPVVTAARAGSAGILKFLLQSGCDANQRSEILTNHKLPSRVNGASALHFACELADSEKVRLLLGYNADPNAKEDRRCERPLHLAVRCRRAVCEAQHEIVELLCKCGANLQALNKKQCSPLYLAALYGCTVKVELLLQLGAKVNSGSGRDSRYGSALHVAAYKNSLDLAAVLIRNGAKINLVNADGYTPLHLNIYTNWRSEIAPLLVYHGSRLDDCNPPGTTLLASCITRNRLDVESLAVLMVQAGYDLSRELWLIPEEFRSIESQIYDPEGRVRRLCDWLRWKQCQVRSLPELCRSVIRFQMVRGTGGRTIVAAIKKLPLPSALQNFLLLKDRSGKNVESTIVHLLENLERNGLED